MTNLSYLGVSLVISNGSITFSDNSWMENLYPLLEITMRSLRVETNNELFVFIQLLLSSHLFTYHDIPGNILNLFSNKTGSVLCTCGQIAFTGSCL